ncbi:hypothetical protein [Rossellomorea vietnamensis]|uniref:hypothetical protein n=1 Tax=Rossellomorea vietnamensis TaxID=218284 RepID=UPI00077C5E4E|nr:hypothetical protein [Rossellomorea vietnamensis]
MSILPERLNEVLREEIYTRNNSNLVRDSIDRLGVDTSAAFQGGDELLFQGALKESWPTFWDFLKAYFNC